ncbi:SMI1/KNR4 family protein [Tundrisphaera sp. TA3]|uniref:SMI1/KNR4 family protein n=1 Tax=Tundrisphaera sp. TA3 TaxID=3435775 RepID=UPI003EB7C1BB
MGHELANLVGRWCDAVGVDAASRPTLAQLALGFPGGLEDRPCCRPGTTPAKLLSWERRYGFLLPGSLKAWLLLSDGLGGPNGPYIHPLSGIGPMVPFARVPGLVIQPESWFELGNPHVETVCIDLAYRWPGGDSPLFTSGDDETGSAPRIMSSGFADWFLRLLRGGGAEYWFAPGFVPLGDPWAEHRLRAPTPPLAEWLRRKLPDALPLVTRGLDDRALAEALGIGFEDAEAIVRHLQHAPLGLATMGAGLED